MRRLTLVDTLLIGALGLVVVSWMVPRQRVEAVLAVEAEVLEDLRDLGRRIEEHKSAAATDVDNDGVGEFPGLEAVFGARAVQFTRVPDTSTYTRNGYYYTLLLPGRRRHPEPSDSPNVTPDAAEMAYALVAWPTDPGKSGMRAYLRTRVDGLLRHAVDGYPYGGADGPPIPRVPLVVGASSGLRPARLAGEHWVHPREER